MVERGLATVESRKSKIEMGIGEATKRRGTGAGMEGPETAVVIYG